MIIDYNFIYIGIALGIVIGFIMISIYFYFCVKKKQFGYEYESVSHELDEEEIDAYIVRSGIHRELEKLSSIIKS
jgi:uncharacterized membrane-anchored protein YhcB (DUF1043 family)